jgi:hypothetical protein
MQSTLDETIMKSWQEVAEETKRILGPHESERVAAAYNDCLALINALQDTYGSDLFTTSLVALSLPTLLKEIPWLHMLFVWGNYPAVHRNLRFIWELTYRAIYADTYKIVLPDDDLGPGPTIDDKINWLSVQERKNKLTRKTLIDPLLRCFHGVNEQGLIDSGLPALWEKLNQRVHPSKELWEEVLAHPHRPMLDVFDEPAARETLRAMEEIFDIIWLGVLTMFHHAVPKLDSADDFLRCPRTQQFVAKKRLDRSESA